MVLGGRELPMAETCNMRCHLWRTHNHKCATCRLIVVWRGVGALKIVAVVVAFYFIFVASTFALVVAFYLSFVLQTLLLLLLLFILFLLQTLWPLLKAGAPSLQLIGTSGGTCNCWYIDVYKCVFECAYVPVYACTYLPINVA